MSSQLKSSSMSFSFMSNGTVQNCLIIIKMCQLDWCSIMSSPRTGILFLIRLDSEQDQDPAGHVILSKIKGYGG